MSYARRAIKISSFVAIAMLFLIVAGGSWKTTEKVNTAQAIDTQSPDLEEHRAELRAKINKALGSGELSQTQAMEFREQISANTNAQSQYTKNNPLSFGQAQQLVSDLANLDSEIQSAIAVNSTSSKSRVTVGTTEVDNMKAYIGDRLERARWSGQLSRPQFDALRNYLEQIDNREAVLKSAHGLVTFEAQRHLLAQLNDLDARITQETNSSLAGKATTFWY